MLLLFVILELLIACYADPLNLSINECALTEPIYGNKLDFIGLRSDLEHQVSSATGDEFRFNICGNLTRSCDGQSNVAACLKHKDKEFVLGTQHTLNYHNGKIFFDFSGGAKCPNGTGDFKLHVFLGCDYTVDKYPMQVTDYSADTCSFYITLETPYACLPEPEEVKANNCTVRDPKSGHTFDLMSLSDNNYRTIDRQGSSFVINVCKPVLYGESAMCPPGSGVCFINHTATDYKKKYLNFGTVQPHPVIEKDQLLMRHTSMTPCDATANYSSVIYFYCDKDIKNAHPELIGFHRCEYAFSFMTPLACNDLPVCTAITHSGDVIDMSSLSKEPFILPLQNKNYTFAVCKNAGSPCLENDGACVTADGQQTSLGRSNSHLRINQTGSVYLLYEGVAACQVSSNSSNTSPTQFWSTKIEFVCTNATKDNSGSSTAVQQGPKIIENSNCQLLIHYQTELACHEQITCKAKVYVDNSGDGTSDDVEVLDLTPLISATENYEAQIDSSLITTKQVATTTKFFLNVCRPLVPKYGLGCPGGSAACMAKVESSTSKPEEEMSLGFPMASIVAINRTMAEIRYLKGSVCPTDKNSQLSMGIKFNCDMRAGRGSPILRTISDCHYEFSWATNVICQPHMCIFNEDTCEITNEQINVSYNLKKAPYTDGGKIKIEENKREFTFNVCGTHHKAVTDYTQGLVNLFFTTKGPCSVDGNVNVQMRLICSEDTQRTISFEDKQCDLLYVQHTPDICKFLGLTVPSKTESTTVLPTQASTTTTTTTTTTTAKTSSTKPSPTDGAHAEKTPPAAENETDKKFSSITVFLISTLVVICLLTTLGLFAFSPQRRNALRRLLRRSSSAVRYSRVQSNEEANLLLEPNGEFTDSDDDMLL